MKFKTDFHTHSTLSHDGGISDVQYEHILENNILDCIAITDHDEIDFAFAMQDKWGEKIIVGEEVSTTDGHLIGLFLKKKIKPKLSAKQTIDEIKSQGGIVYIPHPFDRRRKGITKEELDEIIHDVDIIERFNARYFTPGGNEKANAYATEHQKPTATGTDSHALNEIGRTYTLIDRFPTKETLVQLLGTAQYKTMLMKPWHLFNPKMNKIKKNFKIGKFQN